MAPMRPATRPRVEEERPSLPRPLRPLVPIWFGWFAVFFATGLWAEQHGGTGFFARTVDHFESLWFELVFLGVPLQLALVVVTLMLSAASSSALRRAAVGVGFLVTGLIGVHVVLSVATAL